MPPRAKKNSETPLLESPESRVRSLESLDFDVSAVPGILEYVRLGSQEMWRVGEFKAFVVEFDFGTQARIAGSWERAMTLFHEGAQGYSRGWLLARNLFAITPLILPVNAHADDSRTFTRAELCEARGITNAELGAELDALRQITKSPESTVQSPESSGSGLRTVDSGLLNLDDDLLRRHGFPESMFKVMTYAGKDKEDVARSAEENKLEREWFVNRVREWDRMLSEPFSHSIARDALMNDIYLHRIANEMAPLSTNHPRFKELNSTKRELEQSYAQQREILQDMFPSMNIAGRDAAQVWISEWITGYREYKSDGKTFRIDKVNTAAELEASFWQSVQSPEPAYRFGLNMAIVEAIHHLHDAKFRSQFPHRVLRKADAAAKAAVDAVRQAQGEPLVDMEKGVMTGDDPAGDFPELGAE